VNAEPNHPLLNAYLRKGPGNDCAGPTSSPHVKHGFDSMYTLHIFKIFFNIVIDMEFYNWTLKLGIIKISVLQLIKNQSINWL
jgi:hypothetical protein